ncbi:MAG: ribbon-helix-helix protein, CopG family [Candidatus Bathyarchaeia archaeon]
MKTSNYRAKMLGTRVTSDIHAILEQLAQAQGLTISEYLRQLILKELERLSFVSTRIQQVKETIQNGG